MLLNELFPGFPDDRFGTSYGSKNPKGSGRQWQRGEDYPYVTPPPDLGDPEDEDSVAATRLIAKFRSKIRRSVGRSDMGQTRVDVGNMLGQSGTFNALAERLGMTEPGSIAVMKNSITPIPHFNRMTNRTQSLGDPAQIPNITSGPGIKHRTGTVYGTSHAPLAASEDLVPFMPGAEMWDRDERAYLGLIRNMDRFRELQHRQYGDPPLVASAKAVIVSGHR
jgi:hypothetical protein